MLAAVCAALASRHLPLRKLRALSYSSAARTAEPIGPAESNRAMRGRKPENMMQILMAQVQATVFRSESRKDEGMELFRDQEKSGKALAKRCAE